MQDLPGVTRDRVSYDALWTGRRFVVQDTGGWEPDAKGLQQLVAEQAAVAMRTADAVILVVDTVVGATVYDEAAAKILRRSGKPVFLAANKVDSERAEADAAALWSLGLGEPFTVSALHGRGWPICSTRWSPSCPRWPRCRRAAAARDGSPWSASPTSARARCSTGSPHDERSVVHDVAGTTVDPVDSLIEMDGKIWRFVDTAGLRRRSGKPADTSSTPRCAPTARSMPPKW